MSETRTIEHKGRQLQVHVAPWADDDTGTPKHVHVQDLEGGAGEIVHFDSPRARELGRAHKELAELGWSSDEDERLQAEATSRETEEQQAEATSRETEERKIDAAVQRRLEQQRGTAGFDHQGDEQQ